MNDAGTIALIKRLLAAKTKKDAEDMRKDIGETYLPIFDAVLARISFRRTLDQNSLYHKWLSEIAVHQGETKEDIERQVKLSLGCKILCRDNPKFLDFCQMTLKRLNYATMLQSMDYINVSSVMTTKQMAEYMNEIERKYRMQGVPLTIPEEKT